MEVAYPVALPLPVSLGEPVPLVVVAVRLLLLELFHDVHLPARESVGAEEQLVLPQVSLHLVVLLVALPTVVVRTLHSLCTNPPRSFTSDPHHTWFRNRLSRGPVRLGSSGGSRR